MFGRGSFVLRLLGTLLLIGVLVAGGVMLYRAGQAQGYAMGVAASGNPPAQPGITAPGVVPPYAYYPGYWRGFYGPHFFPFGPLFGLLFFGGLLFFVFFVIGGVFRFRRWGPGGGPYHGHWHDSQSPGEERQGENAEGQAPDR